MRVRSRKESKNDADLAIASTPDDFEEIEAVWPDARLRRVGGAGGAFAWVGLSERVHHRHRDGRQGATKREHDRILFLFTGRETRDVEEKGLTPPSAQEALARKRFPHLRSAL